MKRQLIIGCLMVLTACATVQEDSQPAVEQTTKLAVEEVPLDAPEKEVLLSGGVDPNSEEFHISLRQPSYYKNRTGHRIVNGPASLENTFVPWVVAWGEGMVRVRELELVAISLSGERTSVYKQVWKNGEPIAGGRWRNTSDKWFAEEIEMGWNLRSFRLDRGDVIIDTRGKPNEVHHLWTTTWPHPKMPPGTRKIGFRVVFAVYGKALVHFGLDRYSHDRVKTPVQHGVNRNVWQIIGTPTYNESFNKGSMQEREFLTEVVRE